MNDNNTGIRNILKLIESLQKNACDDCLDNTCSRPFLGTNDNTLCFNTRPVTFYGCDNNLITINYITVVDDVPTTQNSTIFRIEKVMGDCCIVSLLTDNPAATDTTPYISTGQTATINLNCICAIKCLSDSIVN